jgi:hypothetical protein
MKQFKLIYVLISYVLLAWCAAGYATGNVNPSKAGTNTGYVDFHAGQPAALCWRIAKHDDRTQNFKVIYSELSPPSGGFLRLAFALGQYQLQFAFLNRFMGEPGLAGRKAKLINDESVMYQVSFVEAAPLPYQPK